MSSDNPTRRLLGLVERLEARRAHIHAARLAVDVERMLLNVRLEHAVSRPLGVADIVSELWAFTADLALGHGYHLAILVAK
jgi:hypothetical protein